MSFVISEDMLMLCLGRKVGQAVVLGDTAVIRIIRISGNRVRVSIVAPKSVSIRRKELPASQDSRVMRSAPDNSLGRLVLTRKEGEGIVIDDCIYVTFGKPSGSRVQIGVDAPRTVRVLRSELAA